MFIKCKKKLLNNEKIDFELKKINGLKVKIECYNLHQTDSLLSIFGLNYSTPVDS